MQTSSQKIPVVDFQSTPSTTTESGESQSQSPHGGGYASTANTFEESENSESSIWTTNDFQTDDGDGMLGQVSQLSQMSQWSEFSSTSNLDEIITFLEKQDTVENERYGTRACHCCFYICIAYGESASSCRSDHFCTGRNGFRGQRG